MSVHAMMTFTHLANCISHVYMPQVEDVSRRLRTQDQRMTQFNQFVESSLVKAEDLLTALQERGEQLALTKKVCKVHAKVQLHSSCA